MDGVNPILRLFHASLLWAGVLLFWVSSVHAAPLIGMSFPPVASAEHRDFTARALGPLGVTHIRIAENWKRRGMTPDYGPLVGRIADLRAKGFTVLLTVQSDGPDAACIARNDHSCLIADDAPLEAYLTGLLAAVGDDLDAIQFGNEWDNQFVGTTADFLALHDRFARVVRRDRPDLSIVLGGVTGRAAYAKAMCEDRQPLAIEGVDLTETIAEFCGRDEPRNAKVTTAVRTVLAQADYDIADLHLYDAEDLWPAAVDWFVTLTAGRPVWLTEFGGPAPELEPRDPNYQAERLATYLRVVDGLPVDRAYYFKLTDDDGSIHDRSGLYDRRGRPKPSLDVFSAFMAAR